MRYIILRAKRVWLLLEVDVGSAIIRIEGADQAGSLECVLRKLVSGNNNDDTAYKSSNIDAAWVRSFGEYGGVLLEVSDSSVKKSRIDDPDFIKTVNEELKMADPDGAIMARAFPVREEKQSKTKYANRHHFIFSLKQPVARRDNGAIIESDVSYNKIYYQFLELIHKPRNDDHCPLEVVQHDSYPQCQDGKIVAISHMFRAYGPAGVSKSELKLSLYAAWNDYLSKRKDIGDLDHRAKWLTEIEYNTPNLTSIIREVQEIEKLVEGEFVVVQIFTPDASGIFSKTAQALQGELERICLRSSCRSLCGHACMLFAYSCDGIDENRLNKIHDTMKVKLRHFLLEEKTECPDDVLCVNVQRSNVSPYGAVNPWKDDLEASLIAFFVTLSDDKPGFVLNLLRSLLSDSCKYSPSVYLMDAHPGQWESRGFSTRIGFLVPANESRGAMSRLANRLLDSNNVADGWWSKCLEGFEIHHGVRNKEV